MLKLGEVFSCPVKEKQKLTVPGIPRQSPIQVLTRPDPALLPRSDEIGCEIFNFIFLIHRFSITSFHHIHIHTFQFIYMFP